jgi:Rieske Fe-S protein
VLAGVAAVGATTVLAACGSGSDGGTGDTGGSPATVKAADVPVGGGKIISDSKVVVTQPTAGQYKAFSAICTHQGCVVAKIENAKIECTCHHSMFSITDGSVVGGPAPSALPAKTVTLNGDTLTVS